MTYFYFSYTHSNSPADSQLAYGTLMMSVRLSLGRDRPTPQTHTPTFSHSFQTQLGAIPTGNMSWPLQGGQNERNIHYSNPHSIDSLSVCVSMPEYDWTES